MYIYIYTYIYGIYGTVERLCVSMILCDFGRTAPAFQTSTDNQINDRRCACMYTSKCVCVYELSYDLMLKHNANSPHTDEGERHDPNESANVSPFNKVIATNAQLP